MSEWMTTGEMIDRLKVGEVAEADKHSYKVKSDRGGIKFVTDNGETKSEYGANGILVVNGVLREIKWRILPNYVSFEEAMQALKEGKTVKLVGREYGPSLFQLTSRVIGLSEFSFGDLIEGDWTIEG